MLGIIGAMDSEMNALFEKMENRREETVGFSRYISGTLLGVPCVLSRCGIGKVHAALCAQAMILRYHPDAILNIGVAGALRDELQIGDAVVACCAVQHDVDTTPVGDPLGLISGINLVQLPCDEGLRRMLEEAARAAGIRSITAAIATGDQFVVGAERKRGLGMLFDAGACDMEGGAIAQTCYEMATPYAAYRAISDTVEDSGREYYLNLQDACAASARLLEGFLDRWREEARG